MQTSLGQAYWPQFAAPVLALLEQQLDLDARRDMVLLWGMRRTGDFYALDTVQELISQAPNLRVILAAEAGEAIAPTPERLRFIHGSVLDALRSDAQLVAHRDAYVAGPPAMLRELSHALNAQGVDASRIHIDSFGV